MTISCVTARLLFSCCDFIGSRVKWIFVILDESPVLDDCSIQLKKTLKRLEPVM